MRVHHPRRDLLDNSTNCGRSESPYRMNRPPHLVKHHHAISIRRRALQQLRFRPDRRPGDQRHVMSMIVLTFARQQRIFLRTANDQPSDNMNDFHQSGPNQMENITAGEPQRNLR